MNQTEKNQSETKQHEHRAQFVREICEVLKLSPSKDLFERPMHITVSRANYGRPSTVIIELEGSPPRLPIVCDMTFIKFSLVHVKGKTLQAYSAKHKCWISN